jgi:2-dehydro-3-deoxyphosphooctonate aldolase (KDO 8-P synthase)
MPACSTTQQAAVIAGPCSLESEAVCRAVAETQRPPRISHPELNLVFKGSYDKANRTSLPRARAAPDWRRAASLLALVRRDYGFPVLTDVHESTR